MSEEVPMENFSYIPKGMPPGVFMFDHKGKPLQIIGASVTPKVRISRNSLCICGSGKKYKKCCMSKGGADGV